MMKTVKNIGFEITNLPSPNPSTQCTSFRPPFPEPTFPPNSLYGGQSSHNEKWSLDEDSLSLSANISQVNIST
jgi:hypothetical protein